MESNNNSISNSIGARNSMSKAKVAVLISC